LNTFGFFYFRKKPDKIRFFLAFFQSEWLGSGKALSELHIHYKSLLKRVYNHAECTKYWKDFTVALKMIDAIDKKQVHDSVIVGKENASKEWDCIMPMFLTSFMSILCLVMHILCICCKTATRIFSVFFWDKIWLFSVKTGWQPWES